MNRKVKEEVEKMIKKYDINCSVEYFKDAVSWNLFSGEEGLSEDFIREFQGYVDWYEISAHQILSEDFIREFKDKVDWYLISFQKLSEGFIWKMRENININECLRRKIITQQFINKKEIEIREIEIKEKINNRFEILDL